MEERSRQGRGDGILAGETENKLHISKHKAKHKGPAPRWCSEDCQGQDLETSRSGVSLVLLG